MDKSKEVCDELSKLYLNSLNTIKGLQFVKLSVSFIDSYACWRL